MHLAQCNNKFITEERHTTLIKRVSKVFLIFLLDLIDNIINRRSTVHTCLACVCLSEHAKYYYSDVKSTCFNIYLLSFSNYDAWVRFKAT